MATRYSQPQSGARINRSNPYGARVIDAFSGSASYTALGKPIVKAGTVGNAVYSGGIGYRNTNSAGFSFASNLTTENGITIVFEYVQYAVSGSQVLFEHSANQNANAGTFILYTDAGTSRLVYGTSSSGSYDSGYIGIPTLGKKHTVAIRLRFTSALGNADMAIAIDGVLQTTTNTNTSVGAINFGNYSTYFLARAGSSLHADATVGMYAVLRGFGSDADLVNLSAAPWQIFQPTSRAIWVPVGGGNPVVTSDTVADYLIREAVTSDASAAYAIRTSANADTSASYSIAAPVSSDTSASYSILTAGAVTSDTSSSYAIRGVVQSDASIAYELRGAVQASLGSVYDIRQAVQQDAAAAYSLRGAVESDMAAAYAVLALTAVSSDLAASYAVTGVAGLSEADIAAIWAYGVRTITGPTAADIAAAVIALAQTTPIQADLRRVTGQAINGAGTEANPWGP